MSHTRLGVSIRYLMYVCVIEMNRYSPNIKEIKVVSHRKVRRARLYYLRDKLPRLSTFKWAPPVLCCLQPPKVAKLSHSCFHPLLCKNCLFVWLSFGFCFSSCNNITVTYEKSKSKCLVRLPVEVLTLSRNVEQLNLYSVLTESIDFPGKAEKRIFWELIWVFSCLFHFLMTDYNYSLMLSSSWLILISS